MSNGPVARSSMFQTVMDRLGVRIMTHTPTGKAGRRPTARVKELVERLSPYIREHIRRFGQYVLDMDEVPEPLAPEALRLGL